MKIRKTLVCALLALGLVSVGSSGCSIFRATGESVSSVGEGAGHAVSGTGRAISRAASDIDDELD